MLAVRSQIAADVRARRDGWARTPDLERLVGLQDTIDAVLAAPSERDWLAVRERARARLRAWRSEARRYANAEHQSLAFWQRVRQDIDKLWLEHDALNAGVLDCISARFVNASRQAYGARLFEANLANARGVEGFRALFDLLAINRSYFPAAVGTELCGALAIRDRSDLHYRGLQSLLEQKVECEVWPNSAAAFVTRFEEDWLAVRALLSATSFANSGEALRLRVELEQFGRLSNQIFSLRFDGFQREGLRARMWAPVENADKENTAYVRSLLGDRIWFDDETDGAGSQSAAWLIVQHADFDPAFQRDMLDRLGPMVSEGRIRRTEYAMLWDRVAVHEGRPQRFGSQLICEDDQLIARGGVEDIDRLDARRAEYEMQSWETYRLMALTLTRCPE